MDGATQSPGPPARVQRQWTRVGSVVERRLKSLLVDKHDLA